MTGHRSRFRENDDLPLQQDPVVKKKPPFSNVRACKIMRSRDAQAILGNVLKLINMQSRSQSFVPLDQRSENESSGSIHFQITMEITEFCISGFTAHARAVRSLHVWYLWRMPEMDAPRALVFRPLVKGNEALGTRLINMLLIVKHSIVGIV